MTVFLGFSHTTDAPGAVSRRAPDVPGNPVSDIQPPQTHDHGSVRPRYHRNTQCNQQVKTRTTWLLLPPRIYLLHMRSRVDLTLLAVHLQTVLSSKVCCTVSTVNYSRVLCSNFVLTAAHQCVLNTFKIVTMNRASVESTPRPIL